MGNEEINNGNVETWNNAITVLDYKNKRENKFLNVSNDNNVIQVENINKFSSSQVDDKQELSVRDDNPDITVLEEPEKSPDFITLPSLSKKKDDTRRKINKSPQEIYQERLNAKVKVVKKKFTKLARVLYKSYPIYENWLKRVEATTGDSVCKIEPPKQCPPERAQTNRWKFVCIRKLDESSECKLGRQNTNITVNNKTIIKTVWRLGPSEDSVVNANNIFKSYPPFVMRAAKMFEDFINGFLPLKDQTNDEITHCDDQKNQWLFLLVRANSKKELLLFATGKEVSNSSMDGLKRLYDTDVGKDCNVKSLYCKSITNTNNLTLTTTIFLLGSEALDETVGGLKIQLPPKTNFSSSTVGAELLGQAVDELLAPNDKITLVEIGCGLGLICLMIASKCEKVIGYDSLSEIEEAEITSELNKIKNAKFITGPSNEAIGRIATSMRNCKSSAIVNANTKVGRDIEILMGLRKISTLRKVVMITTMAKQSIRAIMELIKPADDVHGNPFIPIRALIVDTMPNGQFFEVAILMERRIMHKLLRPFNDQSSSTKSIENFSSEKNIQTSEKSLILPKIGKFNNKDDNKKINDDNKKKIVDKSISTKTAKDDIVEITKLVKNPFHHDRYNIKNCDFTANNKINQQKNLTNRTIRSRKRSRIDSHRSLSPKKHRNKCINNKTTKHNDPSSTSTTNLSHKRGNNSDLRSRLSNNIHIDDDLIQTFQIQKQILENTIEELKNPVINQDDLNNIAIDKINKVQLQLSRSVWDRIAPPDNITNIDFNNTTLKGSIVHEKSNKNFVIMTPNHQFLESRNNYKKYNNIQIAEPNQVMPNERYLVLNETRDNDHYRYQSNKQQTDEKTPDNWPLSVGVSRKPASPSWIDTHLSPSKRRILSPLHRSVVSSSSRPVVLARCRKVSPPSRSIMTQPRRSLLSPPHPRVPSPSSRRLMSLHRRHYSRERFYQQLSLSSSTSSFRPLCVDDMQKKVTLSRLNSSPPRKQSCQRLSNSNTRQNYENTMQTSGQALKPLIQQRRLSSSPVELIDDWDIPSRGAIEKHDDWQKQKCPQSMLNWDRTKRIDLNNFRNDDLRINKNQANVVNDKLVSSNMFDNRWNDPVLNGKSSIDSWGVHDNESFVKYTNNLRDDSWIESNNNKSDDNRSRLEQQNISRNWNQNNEREDWNDLPEDARDPWADDAVNVDKDRFQNSTQQANWSRNKNQQVECAGSLKNKQSIPPLINTNSSQQNWHKNSMVNQHLLKNSCWTSNANHNLVKKNLPGSIWVQHNTASTWRNFPQ
ncbi:homeobox protein 2-like isoform X2 [Aphidius gifuensis]|uniref:homeobox protein 2-like isoform X2 n=1 Tax=Aphidius gifuensis TaxID=684658 RepID=UPI001CDB967F|nr:homeobox protein 2-like isoform X2 [Aphidius gifuensis]